MREWNGRYRDDQRGGGLAWKLRRKGRRVIVDVVDHRGISNVRVTKTLIDGGAGLNVLSVDTFDNLQVLYDQLQPTKPFS